MKTGIFVALVLLCVAGLGANAAPVHARVDVNVNVGLPVVIEQPPEMVVIPRSNVYFAPDVSVDLFFFDNRWWNRRGDRWYRASDYNGPWTVVGRRHVPASVYRVPANYRTVYVREKRVPYGHWKKSHGKHGGKHYKGHGHGDRRGHHDD